eukprot:CAMPEP_0201546510 /NCGR_PEP_ID=MMETSP0173_2-20130828/2746_1 /ASSEMBLY_ACC=CAM_ASM_000268 /TAXON_ID=218659 /ORGANISM="Vexillifera sp., Strain DIVA3 564/2" /LENGTH=363 /DNA_ID=CAMNT_0047955167 /DNA_START=120 /DNA_END=1211 /DNA_ORIENTATION=-
MTQSEKEGYSPKVDQYAFAMLIFFVLEKKHPYAGESTHATAVKIRSGELPKFSDELLEDSQASVLIQIFQQCAAIDPSQRPSWVAILKDLLSLRVYGGLERSPSSSGVSSSAASSSSDSAVVNLVNSTELYESLAKQQESPQRFAERAWDLHSLSLLKSVKDVKKFAWTKAASIYKEVVSTERSYVDQLYQIIEIEKKASELELLPAQDIANLFPQIKNLFELHIPLLRALGSGAELSQELSSHLPGTVDSYTQYFQQYEQALAILDKLTDINHPFVKWYEQNKKPDALQLSNLLIVPVQRLCKYPLFLGSYRKLAPLCWHDIVEKNIQDVETCISSIDSSQSAIPDFEEQLKIALQFLAQRD